VNFCPQTIVIFKFPVSPPIPSPIFVLPYIYCTDFFSSSCLITSTMFHIPSRCELPPLDKCCFQVSCKFRLSLLYLFYSIFIISILFPSSCLITYTMCHTPPSCELLPLDNCCFQVSCKPIDSLSFISFTLYFLYQFVFSAHVLSPTLCFMYTSLPPRDMWINRDIAMLPNQCSASRHHARQRHRTLGKNPCAFTALSTER